MQSHLLQCVGIASVAAVVLTPLSLVYGAFFPWAEGEQQLAHLRDAHRLVDIGEGYFVSGCGRDREYSRSRAYIALPAALSRPVMYRVTQDSERGFHVTTQPFSRLRVGMLAIAIPLLAWFLSVRPWLSRRRVETPAA